MKRKIHSLGPLNKMIFLLISGFAISSHASAVDLFEVLIKNGKADAAPHDQALLNKIRSRPTTAAVTLIRLNLDALSQPQVSAALADKSPSVIRRKSYDKLSDNSYAWTGSMANAPGESTIVVHDGIVTGSVRNGKKLYKIETVGKGVQALIEVDQSKQPPEEPRSDTHKFTAPSGTPGTPASATHDAGPVTVNVAVAYTPAAKSAEGDIVGLILLATKLANDSYANSKVALTLNLVETYAIDYDEKNVVFDSIVTDFAAMPVANQHRNSTGADLVALLIDKSDYCGLADGIQVDAAHAFAIVYYDCAAGNYSLAHELGHLFGARHDPVNDHESTPPGFSYGHGFQHSSAPAFRTVMAYPCSKNDCPRVGQWSSPDVIYQGVRTGNATTSNNARVLNENAARVAAFHKSLTANAAPSPVNP